MQQWNSYKVKFSTIVDVKATSNWMQCCIGMFCPKKGTFFAWVRFMGDWKLNVHKCLSVVDGENNSI